MATSPLGGFADLSAYRRLVDAQKARNADGLNNLIQSYIEGAQQGNVMVNLPEILQQQNQDRRNKALADQIALQIRGIQLNEAQNPDLALDRTLRAALSGQAATPGTGIIASPIGLEAETIASPGAITAEQQALLESGATSIPTAPLGVPVVPVTGVSGSPTGFSQDLNRAIAESALMAEAKSVAPPRVIPKQVFGIDPTTRRPLIFDPATGTTVLGELPAGTEYGAKPSSSGSKAGSRGLTESSKNNILNRAGKSGLIASDADLDKYKNEAGEIDYARLSIDSGRSEKSSLDAAREAKLNTIPADARNKVAAYQAVQKDLNRLREKLDEDQLRGDIPTGMQDVISASLAEAPEGFFGRVFQRFVLQPNQTKTAAENERLRGAVSASIGRAIAGAALTGTEKQNLIPFTPQAGDSFERLLDKAKGLEEFLNNQIEGLTTPIPTGGNTPTPFYQNKIPTVTTKQQYDALPSGSPYIDRNGKRSTKR